MCPQHDILYDELSAKMQLLLYGTMQVMPNDTLQAKTLPFLEPGYCTSTCFGRRRPTAMLNHTHV
jgi:hypothetical protein